MMSPVQKDPMREGFTEWTWKLALEDAFSRQNVGCDPEAEGQNGERRETDRQADGHVFTLGELNKKPSVAKELAN